MQRRDFLVAAAAAFSASPAFSAPAPDSQARVAAIERRLGGRVGLAVLDTGSGRRLDWRADERFAMCSTFKFLAAAAVLRRVDAGAERLDRVIPYGSADLLEYAPTARAHLAEGGLSVAALCEAAVELSDNTAANLLLASLGGPAGLTRFVRGLGDPLTRLDRNEPTLNTAEPGDPRDTTTPAAMLQDLRRVLLGRALSEASRARLTDWMRNCQTGAKRLRAGVPAGWAVGDKTGSGAHGSTNTIAILWPPGRAPILASLYCMGSSQPRDVIEAAHAEVGRLIGEVFQHG
ncbi:MAG TPA: class A beta-lactamase [Caulobacteraceae bacterium]